MKKLTLSLLLLFPLALHAQYNKARGQLNPLRTCYDVTYYDLALTVDPSQKKISGFNGIHFRVKKPSDQIQIDLYPNLKIDSITYHHQKLSFKRKKTAVVIDLKVKEDSLEHITVYYQGKPKTNIGSSSDHGFHWSKDHKGRDWIGIGCEEIGASSWYPCKDHLSDEPDSTSITITAPKDLVCISNGTLQHQMTSEEMTTSRYLTRYPTNPYNITFYLGHFEKIIIPYKSPNGTKRTIYAYCLDYNLKHANKFFAYVPVIVDYFEKIFGEYPHWDEKFCIVEGGFRGMEHQTCLNIDRIDNFNKRNTDWPGVLAHEIAHEWWGNLVSAADLSDAWIHEGFATYAEALLIQKYYGELSYQKCIKSYTYGIKGTPVVGKRNVGFNSFQDNNIYFSGAYVLHELRGEIKDDEVFFKILRTFIEKYRFKTVMTEDFINHVNKITQKDYGSFLRQKLFK